VLTAAAVALVAPDAAGAQLRFRSCEGGQCARLSVPLDHSGAVPGGLELIVRRHGPRSGPVTLVLPGAPGAPAADAYEWELLMPRRRIVTFDPRGTGKGALRCRDLEAAPPTDAGREAEACANLLGERRGFFRASDTVEDIEMLREALGVDRISVVGPGYGSYVAQRYALGHPEHVERLILASVVDAGGVDPLYLDSVTAARRLLDDLCTGRCRRFTGDAVADTRRLVSQLAAGPLHGPVVDARGHRRTASLSREELLFTLLASDGNPIVRADYPAGVVSALRGDAAPLLRLERRTTRLVAALYPRYISAAAIAAASCEEVRFPWSWHASPAERAEVATAAEMQLAPVLADPFDPGTLVRSDVMRLCSRWPTASPGPPPEPGPMPDVPVLLIANSTVLTTPLETAVRAAARFPRAKLVVTSEFAQLGECGERAVVRFMRGRQVQDRCPHGGPVIPPTAPLPTSLRDLRPFRGVSGRRGRLLTAFAATFADLIDDFYASFLADPDVFLHDQKVRGGGLRGGSFVISRDLLRLRRYEFVPGVRLSGSWRGGVEPRSERPLRIDGPGRLDGALRLGDTNEDLVLRVRGRIAGRRVRVRMHVPSRLVQAVEEEGGFARASALPLLP
jgi:pimeloyl-ACP methyl ester carboxylesterase